MSTLRLVNPGLMMAEDLPLSQITPANYCTSRDGKFDDTTPAQMESAIADYARVSKEKTLALFFHGGLVDKASGMKNASTLVGPYSKADDSGGTPGGNAYPYFFVWESGLFEVLQNLLPQIFGETIFKRLLDIITPRAQKVLGNTPPAASQIMSLRTPSQDVTIGAVGPDVQVSQQDIEGVENAVENDPIIRAEERRIAAAARPVQEAVAESLLTPTRCVQTSAVTLMSPEIVNAIVAEEAQKNSLKARRLDALWSPFSLGALALGAGKILVRIAQRYATARNHNFHNTVVEEIFRQFYVANTGGGVWAEMKRETANAFQSDPDAHVGAKMVQQLITLYDSGERPRITLLGHSTGAIYICNFLVAVDAALQGKSYNHEIKFDIIFMAAAARVDFLANALSRAGSRVNHFRAFGMQDSLESAETLLRLDNQTPTSGVNELLAQIYTSSLLYFVSGVCENVDDDTPLVGMERFFTGNRPFQRGADSSIDTVADFLNGIPNSVVRSDTPAAAAVGLRCSSHHHGGFPTDPETLESVCYLLRTGAY